MKKKSYLLIALAGMLILSGCGKTEKKSGKVGGSEANLMVITENAYKEKVQTLASFYMKKHVGSNVTIQTLPEDAERRENELQKIRTEIMSGKSADVFIMGAPNDLTIQEEQRAPLFADVNKSMQSGVFASLDKYMTEDNFWEKGNYKKEFLSVGQFDGKQYLLPLSCHYHVLASEEENEAIEGGTLAEWIDFTENTENAELKSAVLNADLLYGRWQQPAVDYASKKVLFQKEEWITLAARVLALRNQAADTYFENPVYALEGIYNAVMRAATSDKSYRYQTMPGITGKKMASIETYGAVSMACDKKDFAYEFLMLFLNEECQKDFKENNGMSSPKLSEVLGSYGAPVCRDAWTEWMMNQEVQNEANKKALLDSFDEIEDAYILTQADLNLQNNAAMTASYFFGREASVDELKNQFRQAADAAESEYLVLVKE